MTDFHKPGVCRNGRARANAWDLFQFRPFRVARGRRVSVFGGFADAVCVLFFMRRDFHFFFTLHAHGLLRARDSLPSFTYGGYINTQHVPCVNNAGTASSARAAAVVKGDISSSKVLSSLSTTLRLLQCCSACTAEAEFVNGPGLVPGGTTPPLTVHAT